MKQRNRRNSKALKRLQQPDNKNQNCCLSKRCNYENIWQHFNSNATLEEIRHAAARICRDYLTGPWKVVTPENLVVKRISGGLSNFLYYVSLPDLNDYDELEEHNKHQENVNVSEDFIEATATVTNRSRGFTHDDESAAKAVGVTLMARELINNEDIADAAPSAIQAYKRQRCDSDSRDSSSSKRLHTPKQEPHEVLLRIYGQTHGDHALESMITESVVFALLSERNYGPKLHGIFPGGRIEQYIPARALITAELGEQRILKRVAEKMGEIHSLNIPMSKEPDWIWNCMQRWVSGLESIVNGSVKTNPKSSVLKKQMELMRTFDYVQEMAWIRSIIEDEDYPVVFCHNDLQEGNILMRQPTGQNERTPRESISSLRSNFDETLGDSLDGNSNISDTETHKSHCASPSPCPELDTTNDSALDASFIGDNEPDLIIIDFEYCAYNYRGYDLANHFIEWTFDYTNPQFPYFYHNPSNCATVQQRRDFIVNYLKKYHEDENYNITGQELIKVDAEIQFFTMLSHLFWSLWSVINVTSAIEFGYWEYGIARILEYQKLKAAYQAN
ncbi:choline/ethanolamine kinase isoform X1 [Drosophila sechellia]|uniref:GM16134 n=1 Tax=Drosophila sechellia TaxID=7238 RepID=B4IIF9_DROSE|nr:choline/ethanolamine kinase isoform X1 [Drosophila sechellia]EDW49709.1 GM16134 [Drosophila sechellia]